MSLVCDVSHANMRTLGHYPSLTHFFQGVFPPSFHWLEDRLCCVIVNLRYKSNVQHTHVHVHSQKHTCAPKKPQTCIVPWNLGMRLLTSSIPKEGYPYLGKWNQKFFLLFTMSDGGLVHYSHSNADIGLFIKSKKHSLKPTLSDPTLVCFGKIRIYIPLF